MRNRIITKARHRRGESCSWSAVFYGSTVIHKCYRRCPIRFVQTLQ